MICRSLVTALFLLLAFAAAYGNVLGIGYPTGLLFLCFAALIWFQWDVISEGFRAARDESSVPIIRMGAKAIGGIAFLKHGSRERRSSSTPSGCD